MNIINFFFNEFEKKDISRISKNLISKISQNFSLFFIQFAFPPLMIWIYGIENFGIWIFLTSLPSIISIFNFNINAAALTEMSINFNKKDNNKISKVFTNSLFVTFSFILFLIILIFCVLNFNLVNFKILSILDKKEISTILFFIFGSFILNIFNSIFQTGINYKGNLGIDTYLEIFFDFLVKILIISSGIYFKSLLFASFILFLGMIFKVITYLLIFIKLTKGKIFKMRLISFYEIKRLFKLSIPYYTESLTFIFKENFQVILIGLFFNATLVGMIATLKTLFYFFLLRIWGTLQSILYFEFTKLFTKKKFIIINKFILKLFYLYLTYILLFLFCVFAFGEDVYDYWTKYSYDAKLGIILLISIDISIVILASKLKILSKSINRFNLVTIFSFIVGIFILLFVYTLFNLGYSYEYLFYVNIIGSSLVAIFNHFMLKQLIKNENIH